MDDTEGVQKCWMTSEEGGQKEERGGREERAPRREEEGSRQGGKGRQEEREGGVHVGGAVFGSACVNMFYNHFRVFELLIFGGWHV